MHMPKWLDHYLEWTQPPDDANVPWWSRYLRTLVHTSILAAIVVGVILLLR